MTLIPQFGKMINQILTIWTFPFAAWNSADLYTHSQLLSFHQLARSQNTVAIFPTAAACKRRLSLVSPRFGSNLSLWFGQGRHCCGVKWAQTSIWMRHWRPTSSTLCLACGLSVRTSLCWKAWMLKPNCLNWSQSKQRTRKLIPFCEINRKAIPCKAVITVVWFF